jgi:DNA-binding MarR family transcriptional regulator
MLPGQRLIIVGIRIWCATHHLWFYRLQKVRIVKLDLSLYDKIFENRVRLQIMSVLAANEEYDFNSLKELLDVTDGNLASNLKTLEKEEYISVEKSFVDRKPNTRYKRTTKGLKAFENHLIALENLIKQQYK